MLWIAFVLCTFGLIYSGCRDGSDYKAVVNCFRSLYLWVDLQPVTTKINIFDSCELLSFFVPLGWFTAESENVYRSLRLWIAFVLCTFGLIYSLNARTANTSAVVNCFRSLYLWVDLQPESRSLTVISSCELLSFFVPLGWFTAEAAPVASSLELWIAFVLCTFGLIYSDFPIIVSKRGVVNCFRSLYLWVDLQRPFYLLFRLLCCELLSFFVPLGWFTALTLLTARN